MSKIRQINSAYVQNDLERLRELGKSPGGYIDDGIRRRVWPLVLELEENDVDDVNGDKVCRDEDQVDLDTVRSFVYFLPERTIFRHD